MTSLTKEQHALVSIIDKIILPRINHTGLENIFVACPQWHGAMKLPHEMKATRKALRGKRVSLRGGRAYGKSSILDAKWPIDNLSSARAPKMTFVLKYPFTTQIADYQLHCQPWHGILIPAGIPFTADQHVLQEKWELLQIMPYQTGTICWHSRRWIDKNGEPSIIEQSCSVPNSQATFYITQLMEEAVSRGKYACIICDGLLKIAMSILSRELQESPLLETGKIIFDENGNGQKMSLSSIKEAEKYIERNLRKPLCIAAVARHVCMSRTVFTEQFRVRTGKTFTHYIQDIRFQKACELLRGGDLGIHHIAAAVGLKPNRMRVLFQERLGISPSEYRQKERVKQCNKK